MLPATGATRATRPGSDFVKEKRFYIPNLWLFITVMGSAEVSFCCYRGSVFFCGDLYLKPKVAAGIFCSLFFSSLRFTLSSLSIKTN